MTVRVHYDHGREPQGSYPCARVTYVRSAEEAVAVCRRLEAERAVEIEREEREAADPMTNAGDAGGQTT